MAAGGPTDYLSANFFQKIFFSISIFIFSVYGLMMMCDIYVFVPILWLNVGQNSYYFVIYVGWCVYKIRFKSIFSRFKRLFCIQ